VRGNLYLRVSTEKQADTRRLRRKRRCRGRGRAGSGPPSSARG